MVAQHNPFTITPANPLEALMLATQGYDRAQKSSRETMAADARAAAADEIARGGDPKSALARLLAVGATQDAQVISSMQNNDADRTWRREEATRAQQNSDRSFGLQEKQLSATLGNQSFSRNIQQQELDLKRKALEQKDAPNTVAEAESRRKAVIAQGHDPSDPTLRAYILSGKMPREDQQPLTAGDKKAILEADEGVMMAQTAIDSLKKAKELSKTAMSGSFANQRAYVGSFLPGEGKSEDTLELDNVVTTNALSQLKAIFGGAPTEGERKILLDIQGSSSLPDKVRQRIYDRAIGLANNRLKLNQDRTNELRGGTFYKPAGGKPAAGAPSAPAGAADPLGIR